MDNVEYDLDGTPWEAVLALVGFPGPPFGDFLAHFDDLDLHKRLRNARF